MSRPEKDAPWLRPASSLTTPRQARSHRGGRRRLFWATVAAAAGLVLLVLLGPDEKAVKERFEYYGAPGELKIMQEISIDKGREEVHQIPKSLQVDPPPANIEVEREKTSKNGTVEVPPPDLQKPNQVETDDRHPRDNAEMSSDQQVEMAKPMQSNPDFFILDMVYPEYPSDISEAERRIPVITVQVAIFVGPDGLVTDAWVIKTDGSSRFVEETIKAMKLWKFGWRVDPGIGRSYVIPWRFKSPYFSPEGIAR